MIDFTEGKINFGARNIDSISDDEDLRGLAGEGLIEKRETGRNKIYYYAESAVDGMRFGAYIRLQEKRIEWIRLHWLDSPTKGWDDASDKAMMDEYRLLLNFVKKTTGSSPDNKIRRKYIWRFKWGQLEVSFEPRAYQADIFMRFL